MLLQRLNGSQNHRIPIWLADGTSTGGGGKTGLSGASPGLIIAARAEGQATPTVYTAAAGTIDPIATIGTYVAPTAGKCRFGQVDATNEPGSYELQLANSLFSIGGASWLKITVQSAASNVPVQQFLYDLQPQVDVRSFGGQPGVFNSGIPSVDVSTLGGSATALAALVAELGARGVGTITNTSFAPTTSAFEVTEFQDLENDPVYVYRGIVVLSGINVRRVTTVLTDQVGTSGRRLTVVALPDSFANGDKILVL